MKPSSLLLGMLFFMFMIVSASWLLGGLASEYGISADTGWNETYDDISYMTGLSIDMENQTQGASIDDTDAYGSLSKGGFNVLKMVFGAKSVVVSIMNNLAAEFGIPAWEVMFFTAVLSIIITLTIIGIIFGRGGL